MKPSETRQAPEGDSQLELFAPTFADVAFRDQQDLMENPLCSLGKKPRTEPIRYQVGDKFVTVSANSETGIATIYDHDILIWAATQIREALDQGLPTSRYIVFHPYNVLKAIRRDTGGANYERLKEALDRLQGTRVVTSIRDSEGNEKKGGKQGVTLNLLNSWGYQKQKDPADDRWFIEIHDWMYRGIVNHKLVLSIDPDYFLLESGIDRWLYRIFRKHAGQQETGWQFTMRQLYAKSGSTQRFSNFALDVRKAIARANESNRIPGYHLTLMRNGDGDEIVLGNSRSNLAVDHPAFQPKKFSRRRMAPHGMNPPQWDNRPFAELARKENAPRQKGRKSTKPKIEDANS